MRFGVVSGTFEKIDNTTFKLIPWSGLPGFIVHGSEDDAKYEVWAKVSVIDADSASLIASWLEDENYKQSYIEFKLDYANQKVILGLFIETEDVNPVAALDRLWKINLGQEYELSMKINIDSDGDYYVQCFVDGAEVFWFDYVGTLLQKGLCGAKVDGVDSKSCQFRDFFTGGIGSRAFVEEILKSTNLVDQIPIETAWNLVNLAIESINSSLASSYTWDTLSGDSLYAVKLLSAIKFLCYVTGGTSIGISFSLGPLSVSPQSTTNYSAMFEQIKAEFETLMVRLTATATTSQTGVFKVGESE